jgi:hypothetical protein
LRELRPQKIYRGGEISGIAKALGLDDSILRIGLSRNDLRATEENRQERNCPTTENAPPNKEASRPGCCCGCHHYPSREPHFILAVRYKIVRVCAGMIGTKLDRTKVFGAILTRRKHGQAQVLSDPVGQNEMDEELLHVH